MTLKDIIYKTLFTGTMLTSALLPHNKLLGQDTNRYEPTALFTIQKAAGIQNQSIIIKGAGEKLYGLIPSVKNKIFTLINENVDIDKNNIVSKIEADNYLKKVIYATLIEYDGEEGYNAIAKEKIQQIKNDKLELLKYTEIKRGKLEYYSEN